MLVSRQLTKPPIRPSFQGFQRYSCIFLCLFCREEHDTVLDLPEVVLFAVQKLRVWEE